MKAVIYTRYGAPDVLQLAEVEKPVPKANQLLIKVCAASLNTLDRATYGAPLFVRLIAGNGLRKPKNQRIGVDLAGRVEAVGSAVTQFRAGDEVFGGGQGAFAEYACAREDAVVPKPPTMSFATAAAIPVAGLTALQGLRDKGGIQAGQQVLIYGAGGGVGTFAVQIAKAFGAEVTAVCGPHNVEMVHTIGADQVIDYTQEDFTKPRRRYDLIAAVNGQQSMVNYRRALKPKGRCVVIGGSLTQVAQALLFGPLLSKVGSQKIGFMGIAKFNQQDLVVLRDLLEAGKVTPVIDRCYPLNEITDGLRYLEEGHARGKVIITLE
ncbi:MAG: NAD(P)-dependent alcohol dehydrogenase [Caldilineaceae bacterium]